MTRPPPTRPAPSRAAFLQAVAASGVGPTVRDLVRRLDDLPPDAPAPVLAHRLVVLGVLTRFQADRLLAGKTHGLCLGPYLILEPLGAADGGREWKARHRVMDRLACVWLPASSGNPAAQAARLAAARAVARLAHPHVLTVLDVQGGPRPHVVTEYVDGAGLDAVARLAGKLPVGRACDLVRQVALGVAHAHDRGLAHGDLSASAVRVGRPGGGGPEGRMGVKVGGFGGRPADPDAVHSDRLALGRLLAHLLAGREGADPAELPPPLAALVAHPLPAADLAARLEPFADPDADGLVRFDLPAPCSGVGALSGSLASGAVATSPAEACPFADLLADQPTDAGGVTRAGPGGGGRLWLATGVAAGVSLLVMVLVAAMLR